jgi:CBS domain containing-hemolysin-like protein
MWDRHAVRVLAKKHHDEVLAASARGKNGYQLSIDHQDRVNALADGMEPDEAVRFLEMYTEEKEALTQQTIDQTAALNAQSQELETRRIEEKLQATDKAPNLFFTAAYGLLILALLPIVLGRIGPTELATLAVFLIPAPFILLFLDLLKWLKVRNGQVRQRKKKENIRFTREWHEAQSKRKRM